MKKTENPLDLLIDQLADIHSAEEQISKTLPELAELASDPGLRGLIEHHANEAIAQLGVVSDLLRKHGRPRGDDCCKAIAGLIEGGDAHLAGVANPQTRDLMMIAHCLRIEHYEIAAYTITQRLAERLELHDEANQLSTLLAQEKDAARFLTDLEPHIFHVAAAGS